MAGGEHRHQLVAQLDVGHRLALGVAGAQQQREDVGALVEVGLAPAERDLLVEQAVGHREPALEPAPGAERAEIALQYRRHEERGAHVHDRRQRPAQALDPLGVGDAEDRPADHLEGEDPHPGAHPELRAPLPARDLGLGDVADHLAEGTDRRALERRQQELALAQVLGSVEHEDRLVAEHGGEGGVRLPRVQVGLVAGEQIPDRRRVGHVYAGAEDQIADGEDVPVAPLPAEQRLQRPADQSRRVDRGRGPGPRWQRRPAAHHAAGVIAANIRAPGYEVGQRRPGRFRAPCSSSAPD